LQEFTSATFFSEKPKMKKKKEKEKRKNWWKVAKNTENTKQPKV